MARCLHALRQHRHPATRAAANLVAARHVQQPVAAGLIVERRGERGALAIEIQLMPHVLLHAAMSAAIAAAIAASSPGSARSQSGVPAMPSAPRSEEHTSELQSLMRISYDAFCLNTQKQKTTDRTNKKTTRTPNNLTTDNIK